MESFRRCSGSIAMNGSLLVMRGAIEIDGVDLSTNRYRYRLHVRAIGRAMGGRDETSPPQVPAAGCRRGRYVERAVRGKSASLSITAGTDHRRLCARWRTGHSCSTDRSMAFG